MKYQGINVFRRIPVMVVSLTQGPHPSHPPRRGGDSLCFIVALSYEAETFDTCPAERRRDNAAGRDAQLNSLGSAAGVTEDCARCVGCQWPGPPDTLGANMISN